MSKLMGRCRNGGIEQAGCTYTIGFADESSYIKTAFMEDEK